MPDMLFILLLALVVLGPGKLPEFARQLGRYRAKFKRMQRELVDQIEAEMSTRHQEGDTELRADLH